MPPFAHLSQTALLEFARRQPGAPTCSGCGQPFRLSFHDGRLAELNCACGTLRSIWAPEAVPPQDDTEPES
jgi:hypothetical protein